jgi:hypothetical protein
MLVMHAATLLLLSSCSDKKSMDTAAHGTAERRSSGQGTASADAGTPGDSRDNSGSDAGGTGSLESDGASTGTSTANIDEEEGEQQALPPVPITGLYLACDFVREPTAADSSARVGCRMAEDGTGAKRDMSRHPEYTWGFKKSDVADVSLTISARADDPWHAYYDISGVYYLSRAVIDEIEVGLKRQDDSATYYQKIGSVTGKLGILLQGTWTSRCYRAGGGIYVKEKSTVSGGKETFYAEQGEDPTCNGALMVVEERTVTILKLSFDGTTFSVDRKWDSWTNTPRDPRAVTALSSRCPGLNFQQDVPTDIRSCIAETKMHLNDAYLTYNMVKLDEASNPPCVRTSWPTDSLPGTAPELRANDFADTVGSCRTGP